MTEFQNKVLALIATQQKGLHEYHPARMAGEQLADIARREPESAELLAKDLEGKGMTILDAEKQIKKKADEIHKTHSGGVAVPPWIAEDILRQFYGMRERTWGPGKERDDEGDRGAHCAPLQEEKTGKGKILDLTDFF